MSVVVAADDAKWLDGVLADARRKGALGVGNSALIRLAFSRLRAEPSDKVVAELIRLRGRGQDQ
jgi:hypothetical protein